MPKNSVKFLTSPPAILAVGFLCLITLGCILLKLPACTIEPITWIQAAFTATSAVTVTGLSIVDTANYTRLGQVIIAILIQFGGLGFMTFAVFAFISLQRRLNIVGQKIAREAFAETSFGDISTTAKSVITIALSVELIGFIALSLAFLKEMPASEALYAGFFYTVSAFNNAGFALTSDNLMPYADNKSINIIITSLIIIGGLGFIVVKDIIDNRSWRKISVNTKVVVTTTVALNFMAFVLFWLLEHNNLNTLGHLSFSNQLTAAWFQAITPRTAGFNTIPIEQLTDASTLLTMFLMFIGGGSLSTASGIKIGTFVILILTTWAFLRQRDHVIVFKRRIPDRLVRKSLALISITMMLIFISVFVLSVVEADHPLDDVLFEVVSALSTVGLTRGLTTKLSSTGEIVIMFMMFAGRVGPLTLAYLIAMPKSSRVHYPETNVLVG
ncbi:TrkH family potassium uptake protein [Psychrobacter sanguinis]|uniref:TrkH family potassium uptake protein n=1 Tax=Psychrobacter sanguinis TaxID=861445 RepID=UPI00191AD98D|nr:TrkH family potassium uptake protein [Psychrobacter sanguinis]MCC3344010.1 TrkH family potassium uptake protein [Psychrobacter sanguinis]